MAKPKFKSPFKPDKIPHGTITVPEPSIGRASTNAIPSAIISGKPTSKPAKYIIYNPINDIIKEISISVACAFK